MKQNPAQPENRLHFWVRMVQSYTVGLSPGDVMEAASWCLKTENDGDACGVCHAVSVVRGRLDKCPCARCRPDIKRMAS